MKKIWKRSAAVILAAAMLLGSMVSAYAANTTDEVQGSVSDEEVKVEAGDKPFVSFGADLRASEKTKVLELLGLKEADLQNYDVIQVTNKEEHEYLDSYISKSRIGNRALSSVVVMSGEKDAGIQVTTKNINYCTTGMYENALATAGLSDAKVIVAGPFEISGTAALIGAIKAYSVMSGEDISEDNIDGAIDEIVTTGKLESETGSTDEVEGMIAYLKNKVAGKNLSDKELQSVISDGEKKFNISLTDDQKAELTSLLGKLQGLNLNKESLQKQAQNVYDKLKEIGSNIDVDALTEQAQGFFAKLIAFIKSLFGKN